MPMPIANLPQILG